MSNAETATTGTVIKDVDRSVGPLGQWLLTPLGLTASRLSLLVVFLILWEQTSLHWDLRFWISRPSAIGATIWTWALDGSLWRHLYVTLLAMSLGYVIGCAVGLAAGILLGIMGKLQAVVSPFITAVYVLPKIAIAPLLIIAFGIGIESKAALAAITVFFVVLYNTIGGVRDVDQDMRQSLRIMGASQFEVVRHLLLPAARPWIYTGMRLAVRQAFTATIIAEIIGANAGLGYLIELNAGMYNTTGVFSAVVVLAFVAVALTEFLSWIEARSQKHVK